MSNTAITTKDEIHYGNDLQMKTPIEIALGVDENGMTTARKLYEFLELAQGQFSRWAKTNIIENEFATLNEDYWGFDIDVEGNKTADYRLTAHFAKKLSCKGNSKKAELAREYFTTVEERAKKLAIDRSQLSPQLQMFGQMFEAMAKQELEQKRQAEQLNRIEKRQDVIIETFMKTEETEDFKSWVNKCLSKIAESDLYNPFMTRTERHKRVRSESYERLNDKRPCRLKQRVSQAQGEALQNGATQTQAKSINQLTIISNDKNLRPVYETVIKEMMMCYCVEV